MRRFLISTYVNKSARKRRHAKVGSEFLSHLHDHIEKPQIVQQVRFSKRFRAKLGALSLLSVFFASFVLPNFSYWANAEEHFISVEDDSLAFMDEDSRNLLIASEDGFIEKPLLQTETGDRTILSDVSQYTVKEGDTISTIAKEFGIDSRTILEVNDIANASHIRAGQTLQILPVSGVLHQMTKSESIAEVAKRYRVSKELIAKQNNLDADATLAKGTKVIIPGARTIRVEPTVAATSRVAGAVPAASGSANIFSSKPTNTVLQNSSGTKMIWPSKNPLVTQKYRYGHPALDIAYTSGDHTTGIHAGAGGKVIIAQGGWNGGYGNQIVIDHGNGLKTRYAHLSKIYVKVGQYVSQGELIGWMGKTGRVYGRTGLHLHWEVILNNQRVNPYSYL